MKTAGDVRKEPAQDVQVEEDGTKRWTLPSGKQAVMRPYKGRDIKRASRMVDMQREPFLLLFALIAIATTIDGSEVTVEDIEDMDGDDVFDLIGKRQKKAVLSSLPST
jgi:hypothetical protein